MKQVFAYDPGRLNTILVEDPSAFEGVPGFLKKYVREILSPDRTKIPEYLNTFRKGSVGDYDTLFSKDKLRQFKISIQTKTSGSDIKKLWSAIEKVD